MTAHTLGEIAREIGATLEGLAERAVRGMASIEDAGPGDLCYAAAPTMVDQVRAGKAAGVIVGDDFPPLPGHNLLRVANPKIGFVRAMELFRPDRNQRGIHPTAVVSHDAKIGDDVGIGPLAVIESGARIGRGTQVRAGAYIGRSVRVGRHCDIGANVVVLEGTRIGHRCILHPGVVLGADGYGFQWMDDHHHKIPQLGVVVLEDDVEIGANSCVDRATLGETRIGRGSKLDNLVHIAHNNLIGEHVLLTAHVAIAGSCRIGNGVVAGGQVGVADHVQIGDGVQLAAQCGVIGDIDAGQRVWGTPARPKSRVLREQSALGRLPDLIKLARRQEQELQALHERITALEARQAAD